MDAAALPWWIWPIALFAVSFAIGIVAVLAGVGTDVDLSAAALPHMSIRTGSVGGIEARICRVSFTGEVSYRGGHILAVPFCFAGKAGHAIHFIANLKLGYAFTQLDNLTGDIPTENVRQLAFGDAWKREFAGPIIYRVNASSSNAYQHFTSLWFRPLNVFILQYIRLTKRMNAHRFYGSHRFFFSLLEHTCILSKTVMSIHSLCLYSLAVS